MRNKPKILYYSDCTFFAGCENMIATFLNDKSLNEQFEVTFLHRASAVYTSGLESRVDISEKHILTVNLPAPNIVHNYFKKKIVNRRLRMILSAPIILMWKYYCIIFSIIPLYKKIKKLPIDVLHINNGGYPAAFSCYSMVIVASLLKLKKIIYVVNNITEDYKSPFRWLDWFLDMFVKGKVTYFITGSKYAKRALIKVLGLRPDQAVNIPNGVLPRKVTQDSATFRTSLNIPLDRVVFSVIALLEIRKGHRFLLESIVKLKQNPIFESQHFPLFIFEGLGAEKENIEIFITENCLDDDVMMIGTVKDIYNLINATNVLVLPSIANEDFPNIILEAMLNGKPVIGTKIAGIPEQIVHGVTGYVVEPNNLNQMGEAVLNLLNVYIRESFAIHAKRRFEENFTISTSMSRYINLYKK